MRNSPVNKNEVYAKRAVLFDQQAARAEVRRARAVKLGNKREADGAVKTIQDAKESAQRLRELINQ